MNTIDPIKKSAVFSIFGKYYGQKLIDILDECCNKANSFCNLVKGCLGISSTGAPNLFLAQTGNWVEITTPTINVTYSELYDLTINGELKTGQWYRLTNYKSTNFLNGYATAQNNPTPTDPNFNPREVHIGEEEVLILQATSPYQIAEIGYSETFPGDIVNYTPLRNKIGLLFDIYNTNTLPNGNVISGFDLQFDGTNVYFEMPVGYPALFGQFFSIYAEFSSGTYFQDGLFVLTPDISIPLFSYSTNNPLLSYPKQVSNIKVENNGQKIILLDLTQQDFLNYDTRTLEVNTIFEIENSYGLIIKRTDTVLNTSIPFDFRGFKYRRFEVDLSALNSEFSIGYYGIGDDFLGQGTTGNFYDFKTFDSAKNVQWEGLNVLYENDNNVFLNGYIEDCKINNEFYSNTIGGSFQDNIVGLEFYNNVIQNSFYNNDVKHFFVYNIISDYFAYNIIGNNFENNKIKSFFSFNTVESNFGSNEIGDNFRHNKIGDYFYENLIDEGFGFGASTSQGNVIGNYFYNNTIGEYFYNNTIADGFYGNTIDDYFQLNSVKVSVPNTDFTANPATYVYGAYNCDIFRRSDFALRLSYYDNLDVLNIDDIDN
jgi:hypothetical protein